MAKVLQLSYVKSLVSPLTNNVVVQKGQNCKFDDAAAEKLLKGFETDSADNRHPRWIERDEGAVEKIDHDFSTQATKATATAGGKITGTINTKDESHTASEAVNSAVAQATAKTPTQRVARKTK